MNIGILIVGLPPECVGGAEIQAANIAMHLSKKHEVTVFTRSRIRSSDSNKVQGYTICKRNFSNIPFVRFPLDIVSTLYCLGRYRRKLDVIIAYQCYIEGVIAVIAKKLFGLPVTVSVRTDKEYLIRNYYKSRFFTPFVFRNADKIFVQSHKVKQALIEELLRSKHHKLSEIVEDKLCIIPNGITLQSVKTSKNNTILYVGRLVKKKGVEYLIYAMRECPDEKLLIVGSGPEMRHLKWIAKDMRNVDFVGKIPPEEVFHYINQCLLLVLPSVGEEGSPNVILEAMAQGIPAIATRVAGIPDLVKHGETGFLVEPGSVKEIVFYIKKLMADDRLREELRKNCLKEVQQYSWSHVLPLMEDELINVANSNVTNQATS